MSLWLIYVLLLFWCAFNFCTVICNYCVPSVNFYYYSVRWMGLNFYLLCLLFA
uniref:Uncharacterized protein E8 n=1 Tax=Bos taurus papillomavirus 4 TaxID=10562 RepID=VE8_BPV4|nr:RecName: Full=Uncharacterized protein E8 [Bos taurus papillomavirus 4]